MVLVLDVRGADKIFWVGSRALYDSVETIDPVCGLNRGWIIVSR